MHQEMTGEPRTYCPLCEPDTDPLGWVSPQPCAQHNSGGPGSEDGEVSSSGVLSGGAEIDADTNRRWCEILHKKSYPPTQVYVAPPTPPPSETDTPQDPEIDCWA